jgi:hypothetical protein
METREHAPTVRAGRIFERTYGVPHKTGAPSRISGASPSWPSAKTQRWPKV